MFESQRVSKPDKHKIPRWSDRCGRCDNATELAFLVVRDDRGNQRVGNGGQFLGSDYTMRPGYSFQSWITRCAHCYSQEVKRG